LGGGLGNSFLGHHHLHHDYNVTTKLKGREEGKEKKKKMNKGKKWKKTTRKK
jgi:hypothetical protein